MKKYNPVYYLLFILLIMGAFASMAQNNYGLKIMGGVAFVFGLVFIIQFISALRKKDKKEVYSLIEIICFFLLSVIFGFRIFYIHFPYIELLFGIAAVLLMLIYFRKMIIRFRHFQPKNSLLAMLVLVFHLSIILFLFSLAMVPFVPQIAKVTGVVALILLLSFIIAGIFKKDFLVGGENVPAFKMVKQFKDHSVIIISLFLLFSLYVGFNRVGLVPGIYSDEFPGAYYELVEKATSRKEKPVEGKYKYDEFMKQYDQFLKHNKINDK
jgi:hypothetical protein